MFPVNVIDAKAGRLGLKYLVTGGHAVDAYGQPRTTLDVDFLILKEDREKWDELLKREGFKLAHDGGTFAQFSAPYGTSWNLDLMLINSQAFTKLHSAAIPVQMLGVTALVPCAEHLIGLKLHALKFGPPHRRDKDLVDVLTLIRSARIDARSDSFKKLVEQFGTGEIYERILRATATG